MNAQKFGELTNNITPEAGNMAKYMVVGSMALVVLALITVVVVILATVTYMKDNAPIETTKADTADPVKKEKTLLIIASVSGILTTLIGVWIALSATKLNKFIN